MAKVINTKPITKPKTDVERTAAQSRTISGLSNLPGFTSALGGSIGTYRLMNRNPTLSLARAMAMLPVRRAAMSLEADDGVPDDVVAFIKTNIDWLWGEYVRNALFALDFGWQAFELVWGLDGQQYVVRKAKPLSPELTKANLDKNNGELLGVHQDRGGVDLFGAECLWYANEAEAGNPYGVSRHENVREDGWNQWRQISAKVGQFATKVAGVIPVIEYPLGQGRDRTNNQLSNDQLAEKVLAGLGSGHGVAMPNVLSEYAQDFARSGTDISKLKAWHIFFLETAGNHGGDLIAMLQHYESLMMRGWLVPERAATEASKAGSRADSETHGDIADDLAGLQFDGIVKVANEGVVDPLLVLNYGEDHRGAVRIVPNAVDRALLQWQRDLMKAVLAAPTSAGLFVRLVDVDALLDSTGLPKSEQVVDPNAPLPGDGGDQPSNNPPPTIQASLMAHRIWRRISNAG